MYLFNPHDLAKKHRYPPSGYDSSDGENLSEGEISSDGDYSSELPDEIVKELILRELYTWEDTPTRQYLMQCANWMQSYDSIWIAYSPISNYYCGGYWPIYDICLQYTDDEPSIEFHSWKGDYEPDRYATVYGSLPYKGTKRKFSGTVWTRGR